MKRQIDRTLNPIRSSKPLAGAGTADGRAGAVNWKFGPKKAAVVEDENEPLPGAGLLGLTGVPTLNQTNAPPECQW